jgi:hypothetical protein
VSLSLSRYLVISFFVVFGGFTGNVSASDDSVEWHCLVKDVSKILNENAAPAFLVSVTEESIRLGKNSYFFKDRYPITKWVNPNAWNAGDTREVFEMLSGDFAYGRAMVSVAGGPLALSAACERF